MQHRIKTKNRQGRCYELALSGILRDPTWTLVHGITDGVNDRARPILQRVVRSGITEGIPAHWLRIKHAWLERGDVCYDPVSDEQLPRAQFYAKHNAIAKGRYSAKEAAELALRSRKDKSLRGYWPAADDDSEGIE